MATLFRFSCVVATVFAFSGCNHASARSHELSPLLSLTTNDQAAVKEVERLGGKVSMVSIVAPGEMPESNPLYYARCSTFEDPRDFRATEESGPKIVVRAPRGRDLKKILAQLARIEAGQSLQLLDRPVDNTDLRAIARLPGVEQIHLDAKNASAAAIARLATMPRLRVLELVNATDAAVAKELARFPSHVLIVKLDESNAAFFDLYTGPAAPPKIDHD